MTAMAEVTSISDWRPARLYPETYPGDRPATSYLLLDDQVHLMYFEDPNDPGSAYIAGKNGGRRSVDSLLRSMGLPGMTDRFAILAYGANRNPGALNIKLRNHGYVSPGNGVGLPVLRGEMRGADVVAGGLSGQGYLYGDLLIESELTSEVVIEAWLTLLDDDQLRVVNDSEGVRGGMYVVARYSGYTIDGVSQVIEPYGYAGNRPILYSPDLGTPLAFKAVNAVNRSLPAMSAREMLDHVLDAFGIRAEISRLTGMPDDENLAAGLARYLNERWWKRFNSEPEPDNGYRYVVDTIGRLIVAHSRAVPTADLKRQQGLALSTDAAYAPGPVATLAKLVGRG